MVARSSDNHVVTTAHGGALHDAAKNGDLKAIAAALDASADIEEQEKGATPLFLAVRSGQCRGGRTADQAWCDVNKEAVLGLPITVAVLKNATDMVRLLLAHGADANGPLRSKPLFVGPDFPLIHACDFVRGTGSDERARDRGRLDFLSDHPIGFRFCQPSSAGDPQCAKPDHLLRFEGRDT